MKSFITSILLFVLATGKLWATGPALKRYQPAQVDSCQEISPKKMVVFVYTDWCKFCHGMEQTTFKNSAVVELLNKDFYFMPFNAEQRGPVVFNGQTFRYRPNGNETGVHELAESLSLPGGNSSYPSLFILNEHYEIIAQYSGFLSARELEQVLKLAATGR